MNIGIEAVYNFTTTDYLDDVSKTYAGINNFPTLPDGAPIRSSPVAGPLLRNRNTANRNPGTPTRLFKPE